MRALRVENDDDGITTRLIEVDEDELMPGEVTVDVEYSSVNFKDGLAMSGKPGVIRDYPLIPGIDLVGRVAADASGRWSPGDRVLVNGFGIGETHHGGLAERARLSADWLVRVPATISSKQAAAIGTAGFTAMLAVLALERAGTLDHSDGSILVTGAAGGVGSIAIAILSGLGHHVTASTGRVEESDYLQALGADAIIDRAELGAPGKPLQGQRWAGAIDSVGGPTLANVLAQTNYGGTVAACGLAQSADLPSTVMPFILRGVTLAGINSVFAPMHLREQAWARLASGLDLGLLDQLTTMVPLAEAPGVGQRILAGGVRGRSVVDVRA